MPHLRLAAAQLNTVVGDLPGNVERILAALGRRRGGGGGPLRGARARHPGLPARGPAPQARLRRRQRGRAREGGGGHRAAARSWSASSAAAPGGHGLANAAAVCARRSGGRRLPQTVPPQLRRVRRAALVRCRRRAADALRGGRCLGRACPSARTSGSTTGPWPTPAGPGPTWWSNLNASPYNRGRRHERLAMLDGAGGRGWLRHRLREPGRRAGRARLRRRLAHRGEPTARCSPSGAQFADDLVVVDLPIGPRRMHAVTELLPRVP